MRRQEKSISERGLLDRIIYESQICHLACSLDGQPYVIPISFGYDGKAIYFHTARSGKKIDIFLSNPQVCLGFESNLNLVTDQENPCGWTFDFQSIIATGKIRVVEDPDRKKYGLNQIMQHYSAKDWEFPEQEIKKITVWQVKLDTITGKRSPAETP